jgi:hypothetical protein
MRELFAAVVRLSDTCVDLCTALAAEPDPRERRLGAASFVVLVHEATQPYRDVLAALDGAAIGAEALAPAPETDAALEGSDRAH